MTLRVRNWAKFQHYRDRRPPWIKFYTELLDDPRFLALPDAAKGQLCALFLLAAKRENELPDAPREIRVLIGCTGKLYIDELVTAGWLLRDQSDASGDASKHASNSASASASNLASKHASADASIRARPRAREREREREKLLFPPTPQPPAPAPAHAFYSDPRTVGFFEHLNPRESTAWKARLDLWLRGESWPGKAPTPAQISDGLVAAMTAKREGSLGEAYVRGCIRKAMEPPESALKVPQTPRGNVGDIVYRNALAATAQLAKLEEESL